MSRFAVGPLLREVLAWPAPRSVDAHPWTPADERRGQGTVCTPVPEQLRACDDPILAQWIATRESLADWRLAMRVVQRFPAVEVMERGHTFDREAAAQALADLRAGKAVATATVVRLARHRLETE